MNKKILFSIAMMFSAMSNAADVNPLTWERQNETKESHQGDSRTNS
ncbi:hypothetical protein NFO77_004245 [Vibrio parahaemolyticus]|nr:hypothetical protein [Vibrio parahaemolyticus]EJG2175919.1 hypothetical protein [Vibrio parahaemolyticus]EJI6220646.1 hypothetical protein [Vibrio parahaemolyticus]